MNIRLTGEINKTHLYPHVLKRWNIRLHPNGHVNWSQYVWKVSFCLRPVFACSTQTRKRQRLRHPNTQCFCFDKMDVEIFNCPAPPPPHIFLNILLTSWFNVFFASFVLFLSFYTTAEYQVITTFYQRSLFSAHRSGTVGRNRSTQRRPIYPTRWPQTV